MSKERKFEIHYGEEGTSYEKSALIIRPEIRIYPVCEPGFAILFRDVLIDAIEEAVRVKCKRYFFSERDKD